jgi:hypothetical protein
VSDRANPKGKTAVAKAEEFGAGIGPAGDELSAHIECAVRRESGADHFTAADQLAPKLQSRKRRCIKISERAAKPLKIGNRFSV